MRVYELMRKVHTELVTIRLWIDASNECCEHSVEHAERIAEGVRLLAESEHDDDDDPMLLAEAIANTFIGINAVEVLDNETGNGGLVYPSWP